MQQKLLIFIISVLIGSGSVTRAQIPLSPATKISGVEHSKAKKLPKPTFPQGCKCKFAKNESVLVEAWVDSYGKIYNASAVSGHPVLRGAAVVAARASTFTSNRVSNVLTGAMAIIQYRFVRNGKISIGVKLIRVETDPFWFETCSDCTPVRRTPTSIPTPQYPQTAKYLQLGDIVNVEIIVNEGGKVETAKAISGHPILKKTSEDAACLAEFAAWDLTPQKVRHILVIPYRYTK